ncbi:MAG TPA: hypothetical protein VHY84_15155 [Bryobacteraceae bacterium]|jgi:hypothetical protein|nr:hypothetical protein [Bryobacteraceae bacterium]
MGGPVGQLNRVGGGVTIVSSFSGQEIDRHPRQLQSLIVPRFM